MDKSKHTEELLKLGNKIVEELELSRKGDTLSRWLAHFISEKMTEALNESDLTKKKMIENEISHLILKVWERRDVGVPNISPVNDLNAVLKVIEVLTEREASFWSFVKRGQEEDSEYSQFSNIYNETGKRIMQGVIALSLSTELLESAVNWKNDFPNILSKEETELIELLKLNIDDFIDFKDLRNPETGDVDQKLIFEKLDGLIEEQREAYESLKSKVLNSGL